MSQGTPLTLVIAGMHRSGTSLTASLLQSAGVDIGEKLAPATPTNVKGHFEDLAFVEFHKQVLSSQGLNNAGWTSYSQVSVPEQYVASARRMINQRADKSLWGWKDPRTVLFLNFWHRVLANPFFIFVYRSPWETIDSLYRRNIESVDDVFYGNPNLALKTWESYNRAILEFFQKYSRESLLISIETIIQNPNQLIQLITEKTEAELDAPPTNLLDSSLLKTEVSSSHRPTLLKEYFPEAIDLYQQLNDASISSNRSEKVNEECYLTNYQNWVLQDWLDLRRLEFCLKQTQNYLKQEQQSLLQLQQENETLKQKLSEMESSKIWKLHQFWVKCKKLFSQLFKRSKNE